METLNQPTNGRTFISQDKLMVTLDLSSLEDDLMKNENLMINFNATELFGNDYEVIIALATTNGPITGPRFYKKITIPMRA